MLSLGRLALAAAPDGPWEQGETRKGCTALAGARGMQPLLAGTDVICYGKKHWAELCRLQLRICVTVVAFGQRQATSSADQFQRAIEKQKNKVQPLL